VRRDSPRKWAFDLGVQPNYMKVLQIPLKRGRFISEQDTLQSPAVVVIDEVLARKFFPKENPIGRRLNISPVYRQWEIVGVVGHAKQVGLAESHDLVFPNGDGKPDGHFLRKLKAIAKKAAVESAELHRFRKTYADTLHEEGVSVNTIRIRLGHESLDVTLAYLKGKDAESDEAQEHANSSSLALYA
jgi:hypothetical protein